MQEESRLKDIYTHLKSRNFDVYFVGQHKGDCLNPYVVVKQGVSSRFQEISTNIDYYELLVYVPKDKPSKVETMLAEVEQAMKDLYPMIKCQNERTEMFFDDTVNGWMRSTLYSNYRRMI